jgi:ADP-glucose pyrophosphorylase
VFKDLIYVHRTARVGIGADLYHRVILMAASEVGAGAKLNNVVVLPAAQIGSGAELESCIVGPWVVVEPEARIRNMLLVAGEPPQAFYPVVRSPAGVGL